MPANEQTTYISNAQSDSYLLVRVVTATQSVQPPALAGTSEWRLDHNATKIGFLTKTGEHVRAVGRFENVSGIIKLDRANVEHSSVSVSIPIGTLSTGVNVRDNDLQGPRYFDVAEFPNASFVSQKIVKAKNGSYTMSGQFTLHGISKTLEVQFEAPKISAREFTTTGTATLDQKDFGLSLLKLHPDGAVWINRVITITIKLRATPGGIGIAPAKPCPCPQTKATGGQKIPAHSAAQKSGAPLNKR